MKLHDVEKALDLFLYLYKTGKIDIRSLEKDTELNYYQLRLRLNNWVSENSVTRGPPEKFIMGQSKIFIKYLKQVKRHYVGYSKSLPMHSSNIKTLIAIFSMKW